jgi:hypothetical protein
MLSPILRLGRDEKGINASGLGTTAPHCEGEPVNPSDSSDSEDISGEGEECLRQW